MLAILLSSQASDQLPVLTAVLFAIVSGVLFGFWLGTRKRSLGRIPDEKPVVYTAPLAAPSGSPLVAGLSHEIRTPLNGIAGMTNFLVHSDLDDGQHECVQTIQSCVDELLTLVNDILDYSTLEAGKLQLECIDFDLRCTLEESLDVFAVQAQSREISLLLDLPEMESLRFRGDPHRVRQVVLNFVSNAVKFSKSGSHVTLSLSVVEVGEGSSRVKLTVADSGVGIARSKVAQLFQAFQQADASTTREYGGTGLGLAISRGIAEMLGGEVGVESVEGEGSTFWFEFELNQQPAQTAEGHVDFERAKVLIVDPNRRARELLVRQLEAWNLDVYQAGTLDEAEARLDGPAPRLTFVDVSLTESELSGFVARLGSDSTRPPAMCLLTNMGVSTELRSEFSQTLFKPLKQAKLLKVLQAVLEGEETNEPEAVAALPSQLEEDPSKSLEGTHFRRLVRILVVDDNQLNRKVAQKMLQRLGYQAHLAVDGKDALAAVSRSPFDLIFMDRQMPVMDGLEATRLIREREGDGRRTPIVALTADALESAREECLAVGMDDFLVKPVTGEELAAKITRWVNCAQV